MRLLLLRRQNAFILLIECRRFVGIIGASGDAKDCFTAFYFFALAQDRRQAKALNACQATRKNQDMELRERESKIAISGVGEVGKAVAARCLCSYRTTVLSVIAGTYSLMNFGSWYTHILAEHKK